MNPFRFFLLIAMSFGLGTLAIPGCGESKNPYAGEPTLEERNREWIASFDAYTQTAIEATQVFASITDDASAEAALPRLEELWRIRSGEQNGWSEGELSGGLDNDAVAADWDAAYERFQAAKKALREEQSRVWNAAADRSPMMKALEIFPLG